MSDWADVDRLLLDPAWYRTDAYLATFKRLRDEDPVHWTEDPKYGKNYWALTRYADCHEYLLDDRGLSNRWDTHVPTTPKRMTPEERYAVGFDVGIAFNDNPVHDLYRRPFNKYFSVPGVRKLRHLAEETADVLVAQAAERGTWEVVEGLALDMPTKFVLGWFGIPEDEWAQVQEAVAGSGRGFMPDHVDAESSILEGVDAKGDHNAIWSYSEKLAADRMENPRDDFISAIVKMKIDGAAMSLHESTSHIFHLIEGALGNTRNAMAMGLWLLTTHPEQARLLLEDPELLNSAIDEILRYASNSPTRLRIANQDMEMGGKLVKAGDWVVAFLKSANFDERQFSDPERFDITRHPNRHLSFGTGIHACLGRHLARLEMAVLLPKLFKTFDITLADEPAWGTNAPGSRLLARMPLTFSPKEKSMRTGGAAWSP